MTAPSPAACLRIDGSFVVGDDEGGGGGALTRTRASPGGWGGGRFSLIGLHFIVNQTTGLCIVFAMSVAFALSMALMTSAETHDIDL